MGPSAESVNQSWKTRFTTRSQGHVCTPYSTLSDAWDRSGIDQKDCEDGLRLLRVACGLKPVMKDYWVYLRLSHVLIL